MANATISAESREGIGRQACKRIRSEGKVPAVLYGRKLEVVHLSVVLDDLEHLLKGDSQIVDLKIADGTETVVVKDLQYDYLGDDVLHVDFARISMDEKIEIAVPVTPKGTSKGVEIGGVLQQTRYEILVSCLPANTPSEFIVDITDLDVGDAIQAGDIVLPEGVEALEEPDLLVIHIVASRGMKGEDEEDEDALETGALEPEVISRGKTDEEEES